MKSIWFNIRNWFFARWFTTEVFSWYSYRRDNGTICKYTPMQIRYREKLAPGYVYIAKAIEGYVCEGGCMGYEYHNEICKHIKTWNYRQAVTNDSGAFRPIRVKQSSIPETCSGTN